MKDRNTAGDPLRHLGRIQSTALEMFKKFHANCALAPMSEGNIRSRSDLPGLAVGDLKEGRSFPIEYCGRTYDWRLDTFLTADGKPQCAICLFQAGGPVGFEARPIFVAAVDAGGEILAPTYEFLDKDPATGDNSVDEYEGAKTVLIDALRQAFSVAFGPTGGFKVGNG